MIIYETTNHRPQKVIVSLFKVDGGVYIGKCRQPIRWQPARF